MEEDESNNESEASKIEEDRRKTKKPSNFAVQKEANLIFLDD